MIYIFQALNIKQITTVEDGAKKCGYDDVSYKCIGWFVASGLSGDIICDVRDVAHVMLLKPLNSQHMLSPMDR